MPLRDYLQLVRLPNLPTAAADSLAGWLLVRGGIVEPMFWIPVAASVALYAGGVALNDCCDLNVDRRERPERPLPSGRVSYGRALGLAIAFLGLGLVLAATGGRATLAVAAALTGCIVAYDLGAKRFVLGALVMGACRGLNLLLGASSGGGATRPGILALALVFSLYIAGVTWISRHETASGRTPALIAGWLVQALALAGLAFVVAQVIGIPLRLAPAVVFRESGLGWLLLAWVSLVSIATSTRAVLNPLPATIQNAVKTGILNLVWLHTAVVWIVCGPTAAAMVATLWIPAALLGKWFYST